MRYSSLLPLSLELGLDILRRLDYLRDVTTLASPCRALRSLLEANAGSVIHAVGNRLVISFDDALRAARAGNLEVEWSGCHFDTPDSPKMSLPLKHELPDLCR